MAGGAPGIHGNGSKFSHGAFGTTRWGQLAGHVHPRSRLWMKAAVAKFPVRFLIADTAGRLR
jgi:hypothetical protein